MDEKKKSIDDLLSDLGVLEEAPVGVELKEAGKASPTQKGPKEVLESFLVGLLVRLDPAHYVEIRQEGNLLKAEVKGGDLGRFIGKEGRTLKAVEYLAGVVLAKHFGSAYRVILDAAGYRKRQEDKIRKIAEDAALTVAMTQEPLHLPPMRPSERRIVHMLLKNHPQVTTESQGEGEERHVVVYPRGQAPSGTGEEA
ncbi:DNA-binding protein [Thermus scotoductus]|uniref:DNA-binding protein n=1 Tax=Thermus scotoductus TaxID=37636 RepID=A0A430V2W3_THESC|nr:R3H domain-containing nucleic acid-binding protein [Thermus scotoductus]RTI00160.1 DNA-binding protein [Thermus scotoductus]RTI17143.1 DNA-binding protein [Thermus scotoductus]